MEQAQMALTAVYLKARHGYIGFVEELPNITIEGRTIEETRSNLRRHAALVFGEERALSAEILDGKDVVRESFLIPVSRG